MVSPNIPSGYDLCGMNTIIITGASRGIGFECALQLAKQAKNEQLIIAVRDLSSGQKTVETIRQQTGHPHLTALVLDLASLGSIRQFRDEFIRGKFGKISVLVNNAGLQNVGETAYTKDGFEETFGINHLGPFYLTMLLLPCMTADARITFTASGTHDPAQKTGMPEPVYKTANLLAHPEQSTEKPMTAGQRRYTTSKLCNVLTTYALHRHLARTNIHVNAFDPGFVPGTGLARQYPPFLRFISDRILPVLVLFMPNVNTAKTSGVNLANLAHAAEYKNANGKYFEGKKEIPSSPDSYKKDLQDDLWTTSLTLTNLKRDDTILAIFEVDQSK